MSNCSCHESVNLEVDLTLVQDRLSHLRQQIDDHLRQQIDGQQIYSSREIFPAEKLIPLSGNITGVAIGKYEGEEGYMLLPFVGIDFWAYWKAEKINSGPNKDTVVNIDIGFPIHTDIIQRLTVTTSCDNFGKCKTTVTERARLEESSSSESTGEIATFSLATTSAYRKKDCPPCYCSTSTLWCSIGCYFNCL